MNSTVTAVKSFRFLGATFSQDLKWDIHIDSIVKKDQQRLYFLRPAEKVQPATGAAETVLLCHHWIRPLHVNNCLVQLSYQIWPKETTEGSPDCWANHWYTPPPHPTPHTHSPRTVLIQSEQKGWENPSEPLTSSTLPLWTVTIWSMLQSSEHQNDQTQEQYLPSGNHLMNTWQLNAEHTTLLYIMLSSHILIFISNFHISYLYIHNGLYYILCFCYFVHCLFVYLYIILYYLCLVLLLSFCCTVDLLSLKQIPCLCKNTWQ